MKIVQIFIFSCLLSCAFSPLKASRYNDFIYVDVIDVSPVIDVVSVPERREICERVTIYPNRPKHSHRGSLLGGIIGGAIGNRFGGGRGRDAATIAGAVIGASIGGNKQKDSHYQARHHSRTNKRCHLETVYIEQEQFIGYDVAYRYDGQVRYVQMDKHPGDKIRLRVDVSVVE